MKLARHYLALLYKLKSLFKTMPHVKSERYSSTSTLVFSPFLRETLPQSNFSQLTTFPPSFLCWLTIFLIFFNAAIFFERTIWVELFDRSTWTLCAHNIKYGIRLLAVVALTFWVVHRRFHMCPLLLISFIHFHETSLELVYLPKKIRGK